LFDVDGEMMELGQREKNEVERMVDVGTDLVHLKLSTTR
jgi:hypothetical protein